MFLWILGGSRSRYDPVVGDLPRPLAPGLVEPAMTRPVVPRKKKAPGVKG